MAHEVRAPRRGFLGSMLAAFGAALVPWRTADHTARWEAPVAQPGALARLTVCAPPARGAGTARVVLVVSTPQELLRMDAGAVEIEGGRGVCDVALKYPYERLVAGPYVYGAEVHLEGVVFKTAQPIRYQLGEPSCFA